MIVNNLTINNKLKLINNSSLVNNGENKVLNGTADKVINDENGSKIVKSSIVVPSKQYDKLSNINIILNKFNDKMAHEDNSIDTSHMFIAVTNQNSADYAYSYDGMTWNLGYLPVQTYWAGICYGNGKFVAVAQGNGGTTVAAYSTDGLTWKQSTLPKSATWNAPVYGNGRYITTSLRDQYVAFSTDGITWDYEYLPSKSYWESIGYGNGKYIVASGHDYTTTVINSNKFAYSTDNCKSWTAGTLPSNIPDGIAYGNNIWVIVTYADRAFYSTDGINWKSTTSNLISGSSFKWEGLIYANGIFMTTDGSTSYGAISKDGINWTEIKLSKEWTSCQWRPCYGNGIWVATSGNNAYFSYSTDGTNWKDAGYLLSIRRSNSWRRPCYADLSGN